MFRLTASSPLPGDTHRIVYNRESVELVREATNDP